MLDAMRESRRSPQVALALYTTIRGKKSNSLIFVFEGNEDLPYYDTVIKKLRSEIIYLPLIAKGKDQVLGLRKLLRKRDKTDKNIRYFIDKDFDGKKGEPAGMDLYVSDGYSIENNLVSKNSLESLLRGEFKCHDPDEESKVNLILEKYESLKEEFFSLMYEANLAIFHARKNGITLGKIENRITKYLDISLEEIKPTGTSIFALIGWPKNHSQEINKSEVNFNRLDPHRDWRGKFIYDFFVTLLKILKDDRTSNSPKYFSKKAGIKFDPKGETIRSLASLASTPKALVEFIEEFRN